MIYFYAFIFLFGFVSELYSADAQRQRALVGLAKIVHDATPLSTDLRKMVESYVGIYQLWTGELSTNTSYFPRRLSDQEFVLVERNGSINVLDAQTGDRKRSLRSRRQLNVLTAEALSPQHVVLALKRGVLRVVDLGEEGGSSSFDIPGVPTGDCRFKGLALLNGGAMPEVAVGDNQSCSIIVFKIDLKKRKYERVSYGVNGSPECITTLPGRKVRFTQCDVLRNTICTLDAVTGQKEWMETPAPNDVDNPADLWVPDRVTEKNLFVLKFAPGINLRHIRNGKDLGTVPGGNPELLVADIPGGFVAGFDNRLVAKDDDGNVTQELLAGQFIREVRYHDGLLTMVSSGAHGEKLSAWCVGAIEEAKEDGGER